VKILLPNIFRLNPPLPDDGFVIEYSIRFATSFIFVAVSSLSLSPDGTLIILEFSRRNESPKGISKIASPAYSTEYSLNLNFSISNCDLASFCNCKKLAIFGLCKKSGSMFLVFSSPFFPHHYGLIRV